MRELTDHQLMLLIQSKQSEALSVLYDRYSSLVYSFAWKTLKDENVAKEIVQAVFMRLWTTKSVYDPEQGRFSSWLLTITRNITTDWLRKRRRDTAPLVQVEPEQLAKIPDEASATPETAAVNSEMKDQIRSAYRDLSAQQIHLLEHFYWQGYSISELATIYNQPIGTVKNRLHQTLKILRRHLVAEGEQS
ncbi:RNA polymerase sigma factor [Paenibacillus glycanilyticus]|uniref:DNA-directed RNA polymerase sigma-70 factor n=1 Tax=Paenibacillus glycanilyticus TaxID=126569 RepID=A0ABQ6NEE1_9BACL|nr:sigma-70 family RNA polymerase sigma factor [Paenibacillus glycanilyticus]GMK43044.1 DNA-directed RNA polymerase sigma-70 factor [Paenibacillus glycanilyticus]